MSTLYTPEIADIICARITAGATVQQAIQGIGYPTLPDFYAWLREAPEFRIAYEIARECKADTLVEQALQLADDCEEEAAAVQKARLQIDTRKWIAAKFVPRRYGEKVELSGDANSPLTVQVLRFGDDQGPERLGAARLPAPVLVGPRARN